MRERERHRTGAVRERCGVSARAPRLWSEWMVVYSVKTLVLEYVYYTSDLISNGIRGIRIHHLGPPTERPKLNLKKGWAAGERV